MSEQGEYAFRRSRTITGTASQDVKAAVEDNGRLKTPRLKMHELHARRRSLLVRLLVVGIMIGIISYMLASYVGLSKSVTITPTPVKSTPNDAYITTIHEYFASHPLEQFTFSLNDTQLNAYVANKHSEVANLVLSKTTQGDRTFLVTLRKPLLVWKTDHGQFYVDASGVSFTLNAYPEPTLSVIDNSGIKTDNGAIASSQFIRFLGQLVAAINDHSIGQVVQISIPANTTRELDVRLEGRNYDIKTNIDRDPLQEAEDITNSIHYLEGKGITPKYIDSRVSGKAFYQQ
jgi:hypothetical protein